MKKISIAMCSWNCKSISSCRDSHTVNDNCCALRIGAIGAPERIPDLYLLKGREKSGNGWEVTQGSRIFPET